MKQFITIALLVLLPFLAFGQTKYQTLTFADTTASELITAPNWGYLAAIVKSTTGGDSLFLTVETDKDGTNEIPISMIALDGADHPFGVTLADSTAGCVIHLDKTVTEPLKYFRVNFDKHTTTTLKLIWKAK